MENLPRPQNPAPIRAEVLPPSMPPAKLHIPQLGQEPASAGTLAYWRILRRWKWTVILSAVAGIAIGLLPTLFMHPSYEARASLEIQNLNENFLNMKQVLPVNEASLSSALSDIQTQIKLLQSDSVLDPVKARMPARAAQLPPEPISAQPWATQLLGFGQRQPDLQAEIRRLADTMVVRSLGQTRIIELTARSSSPRLAAEFLNQVCNEYIDQNMKARWEMSQRTGQWLTRLLEEMRGKLRQSETALQDYARTSGLMFTSDKKNVAEEKLSQLQDELSKAQARRIEKQSRNEMARTNPADSLPDVLNQSSLREYQVKITELRRQRAELTTTYTPEVAKVKRLDAQISSLETAFRSEERNILKRIDNEYNEAMRRESLLSTERATQSRLVSDLNERSIQYNILQRELDSNRQLYDSMLQQAKEATIASAMRASNIRVVDAASLPKVPYSPKPLVNCALGFLICSCMGMLIGFVRERSDSSFREPGEGSQYLSLAELGTILHDSDGRGLLRSPERKSLAKPVSLSLRNRSGSGMSQQLQALELLWLQLCGLRSSLGSESSLVLESFRATVTSVLFSGPNGTTPRLVAVTSAGPREGKTTVVGNLGLMLALTGRRVLLVDGDLRRHRLNELFGLENNRGLGTLLRDGITSDQTLRNFVQETPVPGLSVLTSGPSPVSCVKCLHTRRLPDVLQRLREEYDIVLIDTPPVLQISDARLIGRAADGVILVARAGQTAREAVAAAHQRLAADDTRILGMILNDWNPKSSSREYREYYGREYADAIQE